ncbi:MAG: 2-amino-4-hydroxy-6-hydroxymethyldihydropteridine diphosphokinase [Bacteroidales bacterium]|jgi:2-amino-4-hydroxy-6-hydroxymethyldihydropteridine diphosphokinase|nr:2-amino-4-hydroxy-6-hydroxymethyldihydropteridine diphosphokinase [Bacteroidales bacterium]
MPVVCLSLGSNLGHRASFLSLSTHLISTKIGQLRSLSSIIETEAVGFETYPFLNQVVSVETELSPLQLLDKLQIIEKELGRTQKTVQIEGNPLYHDRTMDIDILLYDDIVLQSEKLTIPHPHLQERAFFIDLLNTLPHPSMD